MNFSEKYDQLISQIEDAVNANEPEIAEKLSKISGTNTRHLSEAFQFISGITLSQYIKQRRLVNAVKYKFKEKCSLEAAAIRYGFPDAATMSKAFKAYFGISPSQVSDSQINAFEPLTLKQLSNAYSTDASFSDNSSVITDEIRQLAESYDMSESEANFAYSLSQERGLPIARAFELVHDFAHQETFPMDDNEFLSIINQLNEYLQREKVFIQNPYKMVEVRRAMEILVELFPHHKLWIDDDPLQMGSIFLCTQGVDIDVSGESSLLLFTELCTIVDNFEIYPVDGESIRFNAAIHGVYKRIN